MTAVIKLKDAYCLEEKNPVCETAKETQMYRTVFWTLWERDRVDDLGEWH